MTVEQAVELTRAALWLSLIIGAPIMVIAVIVGLVISIMQAVTQMQDQTLSFVPKIIAMTLAAVYILPWMFEQMVDYSAQIFHNIPSLL